MAIKGLKKPVFGEYNFNGAAVTYTNGFVCGKAVEYSAEIETSENNPLYGDDEVAENDFGTFSSGTLTLNTTDLDQETSIRLLSLKKVQVQVGETQVTELVTDDDAKQKPKGFGIVEVHQINDVNKYKALILTKVTPQIPADAATTKGESIEWQTKEITSLIQRSDEESENYKHPWKREAWFDTYAEAEEYLKTVLNALNTLSATSAAGTSSGQTKITITNPVAGATYKYSTDGPAPTYKQDLTSWTDLTPGEDITAANGSTLYIAQVNSDKKAIAAGTVTVVANEGP